MNKRILYIVPSILLAIATIYGSMHLTPQRKKQTVKNTGSDTSDNNRQLSRGVVLADETTEPETNKQQSAWENLADNNIVVDGKISRKYLDLPSTKPTTVIQNPVDLTGYIKYEDRTEGNDIEGIFSDLRVKWPVGKEYYDNYYISRDEKANGDLSGKLIDNLKVKWENGTDYYDTKYMPIETSIPNVLNDLTDVNIEGPVDGDSLVWDAGSNKWVANTLETGSASQVLDDLTDVNIEEPVDGDSLVWDAGSNTWIASAVTGGESGTSVQVLNDLTDVNVDTANNINHGDTLVWDDFQSKWIARQVPNASNGLQISYDAEEYPLVQLGGNLNQDTTIDTTDYTLTFNSANTGSDYFQVNENEMTVSTALTLTPTATLQLPLRDDLNPPVCNTSNRGSIGFDSTLNAVCYCDGYTWLKVSDEVTACYTPEG